MERQSFILDADMKVVHAIVLSKVEAAPHATRAHIPEGSLDQAGEDVEGLNKTGPVGAIG